MDTIINKVEEVLGINQESPVEAETVPETTEAPVTEEVVEVAPATIVEVRCPVCGGTGRTAPEVSCETCQGTGLAK